MFIVKAIKEDGYEDVFCCHVVRSRQDFLMLETHGAQTKTGISTKLHTSTGISCEQVIWLKAPHDYSDTVYTIAYVSCEGRTIGTYRRSPCSADETDKVVGTTYSSPKRAA